MIIWEIEYYYQYENSPTTLYLTKELALASINKEELSNYRLVENNEKYIHFLPKYDAEGYLLGDYDGIMIRQREVVDR